jgi:hypothetical protein
MAREEFLLNLRIAASSLNMTVQTDSPHLNGDRLASLLNRCDLWLTPRSVGGFKPDDFPELSPAKRRELREEIERFRAVACKVPANAPATKEQVRDALPHFKRVVELVGEAVIAEWQEALHDLFQSAEDWSRDYGCFVKRGKKQVTEKFLGTYEVPTLLIHTTANNRFVLEPVARQVAGAAGRVDLCLLPSYDSVGIVRMEDGWYILPERPSHRKKALSREVFLNTLDQLARAA